jgi:hypothetical protein
VEQQTARVNSRKAKEDRLLSDLWLMSAATFRRQGKIEQAKAAIQEAEVRDEGNPNVWTQVKISFFFCFLFVQEMTTTFPSSA